MATIKLPSNFPDMDEMMELYKQGKIEELIKIRDSEGEFTEKQMAANMVLQLPKDIRRY